MAGQGADSWRLRLGALGAVLVLALALLAPGIGGAAFAAAGAASTGSAPTPAAPTQTAPAEGSNGNAFSELSQGGSEQETTSTSTEKTPSESSTHNSKKTVIVIVIAALALLVAIAYVIVRDARKNAPATDPQVVEARSAHDAAATLHKRRAKAKAARQARKRNR